MVGQRTPVVEPAADLLDRILTERRHRWEQDQLARYEAKGKKPPKGWKDKYKEPAAPDTTNLPELPAGWCWANLGQVAVFQNGRAFPSKEYADEGVRLLRPGNLYADGSVQWNSKNTRHMPVRWAEQHPSHIVREYELVMNLTAQSLRDEFLGRTCMTGPDEVCLLNQRLARITPIEPLDRRYVLLLLKSAIFRQFVASLNTGSLIQHMFTSQLDNFVFPLPPHAEQVQLVKEAERHLTIIDALAAETDKHLQRAPRLRQAILKRAFAGELVGSEVEALPA